MGLSNQSMMSGKREEKFLQSNGSVGSFDSFGLSLANNGGSKLTKKSHAANSNHSVANSKRSASGGRVLAASQERRSVRDAPNQ